MATLALGLAAASAAPLRAQRAAVGAIRAELRASFGLAVPYRLDLRTLGKAAIIEQTATFTVVEIRVSAAANARWRLDVTGEAGTLDVRCETGDWLPVGLDGSAVPVVYLRAPTDPTEIVVRLRIHGAPAAVQLARAQIVLRPVAADQGAVMVSWTGSE
jgi:hypothetical protein